VKPPSLAQTKAMRADCMAETVPNGWFTRRELEAAWKVSPVQANRLIHDALAFGKAKVKKFRIVTPSRGIYPTQHYYFSE
jgi:hypothetical protein